MTTPGSTTEVGRGASPPRERRSLVPKFALAVPSWLWYIGFFVVPLVFIVVYSFGSKIQGTAGDVDTSHPTLARYGDALSLGQTALAAALDHGDQTQAVFAAFEIAWPLAELGELERSGRLIGAATAFLEEAGFARTRSDLRCEKAVLDALHRRLPADAVHTLLQQGRDTPLERTLGEAPDG